MKKCSCTSINQCSGIREVLFGSPKSQYIQAYFLFYVNVKSKTSFNKEKTKLLVV